MIYKYLLNICSGAFLEFLFDMPLTFFYPVWYNYYLGKLFVGGWNLAVVTSLFQKNTLQNLSTLTGMYGMFFLMRKMII